MNSASWFIYLAQVCGSLGGLFIFLGVVSLITAVIAFFSPGISISPDDLGIDKSKFRLRMSIIIPAILFLTIGNLMPERNTLYAIAISEIGGKVLATDTIAGTADDATKALRSWLKKQIEPTEKK